MSDDDQEPDSSGPSTEDDLFKCSCSPMFAQLEPKNTLAQCHSTKCIKKNFKILQAPSSSSSFQKAFEDRVFGVVPGPSSLTDLVQIEYDTTVEAMEAREQNLWSLESWDRLEAKELPVPPLAPLSEGAGPSTSRTPPSYSSFQRHPKPPPLVPITKSKGKMYSAIANKAMASSSKPRKRKCASDEDEDYYPSSEDEDSDEYERVALTPRRSKTKYSSNKVANEDRLELEDDGDLEKYNLRLKMYYENIGKNAQQLANEDRLNFVQVTANFRMPVTTWNKLYPYQQDGVRWLFKLHEKDTGGILGDEMGLGKTVQVIALLIGIEYTKKRYGSSWIGLGPTLIVCPATVLHQWVRHFREWAPEFRVGVLHLSSTYRGAKSDVVKEIYKSKGIVIVTYQGIVTYAEVVQNYAWHYVILDEGHHIRTPTTMASCAVKKLKTTHRIVVTGSPMQNNMMELWSLFDFSNPGLLGPMQVFEEHFCKPIMKGGYGNATPIQKQTGLSIASLLNSMIRPYFLRRTKNEVQDDICLPSKSEQVLFCALSDEQKKMYKDFLLSEDVSNLLDKGKNWFVDPTARTHVLVAISRLRKLCNHPDLFLRDASDDTDDQNQNFDVRFHYKRSGKMIVVSALLKIWKQQGNRVLLFVQGPQTLNILEHFLDKNEYKYLKMDGSTPVHARQPLIDRFNRDTKYFVFLLTTRVGGVGINLTGANRVIIFDPDWNPAKDTQAKERAWRIGQSKDVTIYRLLSVGTIEEKIYQRQVWKQFLENKILVDPKSDKHIFKSSDLFDLFSFNESDSKPETASLFQDAQIKIPEVVKAEQPVAAFSEEKIKKMRELAHQIASSFPPKKPTAEQQALAEERAEKMEKKDELKKLSAPELLHLNREKAKPKEEPQVNRVDGSVTHGSFSEALQCTDAASMFHAEVVRLLKTPTDATVEKKEVKSEIKKDDLSKKKKGKSLKKKTSSDKECKTCVDSSGAVDDVKVDGLVRTEFKIRKKRKLEPVESQDAYVLKTLFKKTNLSGVLEHDTVVQSTSGGTLKLQMIADGEAHNSLEALRRARTDNYKWEN